MKAYRITTLFSGQGGEVEEEKGKGLWLRLDYAHRQRSRAKQAINSCMKAYRDGRGLFLLASRTVR